MIRAMVLLNTLVLYADMPRTLQITQRFDISLFLGVREPRYHFLQPLNSVLGCGSVSLLQLP